MRVYTQAAWDAPHSKSTHNFLAPVLPTLGITRHERTEWARAGVGHLELVGDPAQADAIVLPDLYYLIEDRHVEEAARLAERHGRLLLLFGHTDHYAEPAAVAPRTLLFHSDLYRSRLRPNQRVHPTLLMFEMNPYTLISEADWSPYPYEPSPGIFFRGAGHMVVESPHRRLLFHLTRNWRTVRLRAVGALARSHDITLTSTFSSGWWSLDEKERRDRKLRFIKEALASPYALVIRGSGNYSFRLYEVMALGRIPVIVDTDTCLPWPELIPWGEISLLVPRQDLRHIGRRLHAFHARFDDAGFASVQQQVRRIWRDHLSEIGFYRTVCAHTAEA